ncbi:MAG: hypothetical protein NZ899_05190 [Thermoguttaceae bacterium]|nr:hypothetical protein [Thermoguttaceae bacterium]MDW8078289.1 hypothetical protein [Thermoguttaceae bacterium]
MAWPALRWTLGAQRLRAAAEQIRVEWTRTRLAAIKNQVPYVFRYVPGESVYTIEPVTGAMSTFGSFQGSWDMPVGYAGQMGDITAGTFGAGPTSSQGAERSLPEGIVFFSGTSNLDLRGQTILEEWSALTGNYAAGWMESVIFYPDGTATDAEVVLESDQGRQVSVWIRGLTGVVQVGPVVRAETTSGL